MSAPATPETKPPSDEPEDIKNAVIRLAGNSQDGIQSVGGFLARLAGRTAQEVMTYMTIPSTISGGAVEPSDSLASNANGLSPKNTSP